MAVLSNIWCNYKLVDIVCQNVKIIKYFSKYKAFILVDVISNSHGYTKAICSILRGYCTLNYCTF